MARRIALSHPKPSMKLQVHPLAKRNLQEHVDYLLAAGFSDDRLLDFQSTVEEAFSKIERNPTTWSFAFRSQTIRKVQIRVFDFRCSILPEVESRPWCSKWRGPGGCQAGAAQLNFGGIVKRTEGDFEDDVSMSKGSGFLVQTRLAGFLPMQSPEHPCSAEARRP
jgi:hypothetical protein